MEELQEQLDKLRKDFEDFKQEQNKSKIQRFEDIKTYEQLKVDKLYANLPVYTATRPDTPVHGELYASSIGGVRKLNIYIKDTLNQAWSATLS